MKKNKLQETTEELLAMYRKSFPIFLKNWKDKEYNKAIKDFNKKKYRREKMPEDINFIKMTKDRVEEEIRFCEYTKKELETRTLPAIRRKIRFYKNMLKKIQKEENEKNKNNNRK